MHLRWIIVAAFLAFFAFFCAFHPSLEEDAVNPELPASALLDAAKNLSVHQITHAEDLLTALGIRTQVDEAWVDEQFGKVSMKLVDNQIRMQASHLQASAERIDVFNSDGQKIFSQATPALEDFRIPAESLEAGVYTYKLVVGADLFCGRFLKK